MIKNQMFIISLCGIISGVGLRLSAYISDWATAFIIVSSVGVYLICRSQVERGVKPEVEVKEIVK